MSAQHGVCVTVYDVKFDGGGYYDIGHRRMYYSDVTVTALLFSVMHYTGLTPYLHPSLYKEKVSDYTS